MSKLKAVNFIYSPFLFYFHSFFDLCPIFLFLELRDRVRVTVTSHHMVRVTITSHICYGMPWTLTFFFFFYLFFLILYFFSFEFLFFLVTMKRHVTLQSHDMMS